MSTKKHSEEKSFDLDFPATEEDILALRQARQQPSSSSLAEFIARLSTMKHLPPASERRSTSEGWIEFSLE